MAGSKRAKATFHAARDKNGRFAKRQAFFNFFGLPPEIRSIVYRHCFSLEGSQPALIGQDAENTLALKLPVLRTSKAVLCEALPVFWGYHMFRIQMARSPLVTTSTKIPNRENVEWLSLRLSRVRWLAPMRRLLSKIELMALSISFMFEWDHTTTPGHILLHFPNLRLLRLDLTAMGRACPPDNYLELLAFLPQTDSKTTRILIELWQRLDRLELVVVDYQNDSSEKFRELIEPSSLWVQDITGKADCGCLRSIWSLQRPHDSLNDAMSARQTSATNRWSMYALL